MFIFIAIIRVQNQIDIQSRPGNAVVTCRIYLEGCNAASVFGLVHLKYFQQGYSFNRHPHPFTDGLHCVLVTCIFHCPECILTQSGLLAVIQTKVNVITAIVQGMPASHADYDFIHSVVTGFMCSARVQNLNWC